MFDPEKFGEAMGLAIREATAPLLERIKALETDLASRPAPVAPVTVKGDPGDSIKGEPGDPGKDGVGMAGAMIDRDGNLQITMTNGEMKNLGKVVGKDGDNGTDGLSLDNFEMEYLPESHEITVKAVCAGRTKELRYPAGGIRPAGYWREGTKAVAGEAWVHDGSLWIALKDVQSKPATNDEGWIIAARKGRDGERGATGKVQTDTPIKLVN